MPQQHSGLQLALLHLYRRALRTLRTKPAHTRPRFLLAMRHLFRAEDQRPRARRDIAGMEAFLRRATRRVQMWEDPSVRDCVPSAAMHTWFAHWRLPHNNVSRK